MLACSAWAGGAGAATPYAHPSSAAAAAPVYTQKQPQQQQQSGAGGAAAAVAAAGADDDDEVRIIMPCHQSVCWSHWINKGGRLKSGSQQTNNNRIFS
jgi:hypothetical protein